MSFRRSKSERDTWLPSWSGSEKSGAFVPASITTFRRALAPQAEFRDQRPVALQVVALEVAKDAAALADHLEQAAAGVMVLAVGAQVLGELVDALGEQRDLDLGGAGVLARPAVLADQLLLSVLRQRHRRNRVAITRRLGPRTWRRSPAPPRRPCASG